MGWGDIAAIGMLVVTVVGLNLGGLRWLLDRRDKKRDAFEAVFDKLAERVLILEKHWENAPGWETMNKLRDGHQRIETELGEISQQVAGVKEEQGHMRDSITRIEDHLMGSKT